MTRGGSRPTAFAALALLVVPAVAAWGCRTAGRAEPQRGAPVTAGPAGSSLAPAELFALLATFREPFPNETDVLGRGAVADRLSGKLAALSADDFLEGLLDFLSAPRDDYISFHCFQYRVEALARAAGGEPGERARLALLLAGLLPEVPFGTTAETAALVKKWTQGPIDAVVGSDRLPAFRKIVLETWTADRDRLAPALLSWADPTRPPAEVSAPPSKSPPEEEEPGAPKPRVAVSSAPLRAADWLLIFAAHLEHHITPCPLDPRLPEVLAPFGDQELFRAVAAGLDSGRLTVVFQESRFWEPVEALLRRRKSEAADRARLCLLLAGVIEDHHQPGLPGADEEELLGKFSSIPIEELAGAENLAGIQELCRSKWIFSFPDPLSARVVARLMTPAFERSLEQQVEEANPLSGDWKVWELSTVFAALALSRGEKGAAYLRGEILREGNEGRTRAAILAAESLPLDQGVPLLLEAYDADRYRDGVLYSLCRLPLAGLPAAEGDRILKIADGYVAGAIGALSEAPGEDGEIDPKDMNAGRSLRWGCQLLEALGAPACDRVLSIVKAIPLDRTVVSERSFHDNPTHAEDRAVVAAGSCGQEAVPELLRLLRHAHAVIRLAALQGLDRAAPGAHLDAVRPLLADPSMPVRLDAATIIGRSPVSEETREDLAKIFSEAFSLERPILTWFGGEGWGECEIAQFAPAARSYHRVLPAKALEDLERILESIAGDAQRSPEERGGWESFDPYRTWPLALPLYLELTGIDVDQPFPLRSLGLSRHDNARQILDEIRRRRRDGRR